MTKTGRILIQIGACLFMFTVGMEVNVRHVRGKSPTAVAISHASMVVPYLLGVLLVNFLFSCLAVPGASFVSFALFIGISMSIAAFRVTTILTGPLLTLFAPRQASVDGLQTPTAPERALDGAETAPR